MDRNHAAWTIRTSDFPHEGDDAEKLAFCVRYAALSCSTYNTQPWRFHISGNILKLYADRRYGLPVIDPDDRELEIACGSALFVLRLAIRCFGYSETTELLPDPDNPDCLARVRLGTLSDYADDNDSALLEVVPRRHANRRPFDNRKPVPDRALHMLKSAAIQENGWLHVCMEPEREFVGRLIVEGDHIQIGDKHFRREMALWADTGRAATGDGMPQYERTYSDIMNSLSQFVYRRFEDKNGQVVSNEELLDGTPVLAIVGAQAGGATERIMVGQALMRVLLTAQTQGLAFSFLSQPCEVPELRLRLHDEFSALGRAHIILRLGLPTQKPFYGPRRALEDIIIREEGGAPPLSGTGAPGKNLAARIRKLFLAK